jgi:hypothetical protein
LRLALPPGVLATLVTMASSWAVSVDEFVAQSLIEMWTAEYHSLD